MTHDKVRQDLETVWREFVKNELGNVTQAEFESFKGGYQAGRAAERAEIREKLESEGVAKIIFDEFDFIVNPAIHSDYMFEKIKSTITKILEVI